MENIEVSVRVRPINPKEFSKNDESVWRVESNSKTITLTQPKMLFKHQNN